MKVRRGRNYERNKANRHRAFKRAKWLHWMLILTLGGRCAQCGERNETLLSIDHPDGCSFRHRALRYDARVSRYVREFAEEECRLRVLCISCNSSIRPGREPGDDYEEITIIDRRNDEAPEAPF